MVDHPHLELLLNELLDSDATPEEVCKSCPELLPVVREKWRRARHLRADLDVLYPPHDDIVPPRQWTDLPQIPGYEVRSVLGRGGMGIVFHARHLRMNRDVALKMLHAGSEATPEERQRFQREAETVARLKHPNIVQVHEIGDRGGQPFFTMEYLEGGSLAGKLARVPQSAHSSSQLVAILAEAVQAAHECGIVHCDLKPGNILLTQEGKPKIIDFGLAHREDDLVDVTKKGLAVGTPSYMAPEQAQGRFEAIGPAVDVYALGAILYELLTGRPPFRAETSAQTVQQVISQEPTPPSRLNDRVPNELETICLKCLNKLPTLRYATAAELAEDLRRYLRNEPTVARSVERLVKWAKRNPWLATSLISGLLLLTAIGALMATTV